MHALRPATLSRSGLGRFDPRWRGGLGGPFGAVAGAGNPGERSGGQFENGHARVVPLNADAKNLMLAALGSNVTYFSLHTSGTPSAANEVALARSTGGTTSPRIFKKGDTWDDVLEKAVALGRQELRQRNV